MVAVAGCEELACEGPDRRGARSARATRWRRGSRPICSARSTCSRWDLQVTAASVGSFDPGGAAAWLAMTEQWDRINGDVVGALFRPFPPILAPLHLTARSVWGARLGWHGSRGPRGQGPGATSIGATHRHQQLTFHPTVGLGGTATPIDQLFRARAPVHRGEGVHGGPRLNAAQAALARAGVRGWATRQASAALMRRLYR